MVSPRSFIALILLVFAASLICTPARTQAPPAPAGQVNQAFIEGARLFNEENDQEAVDKLTQATTEQPDLEPAWFFLGLSHFRLGNVQEAVDALTRSVELEPYRRDTHFYLGQLYEAQGDLEAAVDAYVLEIKMRRGREVADLKNALGRVYAQMGRLRDAVASFTGAITDEDKFLEALYNRGVTYDALGQHELAIRDFELCKEVIEEWEAAQQKVYEVLARRRHAEVTAEMVSQEYAKTEEFVADKRLLPELHMALGRAYDHTKDYDRARNSYRRALDPAEGGNAADPRPVVLVGEAYFHEGRDILLEEGLIGMAHNMLGVAIQSFAEALQVAPGFPPAHHGLGMVYALQASQYESDEVRGIISHTHEEAAEQFLAALQQDPQYVEARLHLGIAYNNTGQYAEAEQQLRQALTLAPGVADVYAALAQSYVGLQEYSQAVQMGEIALALDRDNYQAHNQIGLAQYYLGDLGQAIDHFQRAIRIAPDQYESYVNLGNAYFQSQSWHLARVNYRKALDHIPEALITGTIAKRAYLHLLVGLAFANEGLFEPAIKSYNQALSLDANYLDCLRQLARAYVVTRKYRAAEQALRDALSKSPSQAVDAELHHQMGQAFEAEGRLHEAIASYSTALQIDPTNDAARSALERLQSRGGAGV
ncbi:MAG: tetratricopeptide repeat protein [Armatimonadota bacterium]